MNEDEDLGTLRWFGPSWGAPACRPSMEVFLPAKTSCSLCTAEIGAQESGLRIPFLGAYRNFAYYHLSCFALIVGADGTSSLDCPL